jgi:hypothetical protein
MTITKKDLPTVGRDVLLKMAEELIEIREVLTIFGAGRATRALMLESRVINVMLAVDDERIPSSIISEIRELRKLRLRK